MSAPKFNMPEAQLEDYRKAAEAFEQANNADDNAELVDKLKDALTSGANENEAAQPYVAKPAEQKPIIVNAKLVKGDKHLMRIETVEHEATPEFVKLADGTMVPMLMSRRERRALLNEVKSAIRKGRPIKVKRHKRRK